MSLKQVSVLKAVMVITCGKKTPEFVLQFMKVKKCPEMVYPCLIFEKPSYWKQQKRNIDKFFFSFCFLKSILMIN